MPGCIPTAFLQLLANIARYHMSTTLRTIGVLGVIKHRLISPRSIGEWQVGWVRFNSYNKVPSSDNSGLISRRNN